MSKSHGNGRNKQTIRFLKWINRYSGWWYLICTPNDEHINNSIIQTMTEQLAKEELYEIIFVLLMVRYQRGYVDIYSLLIMSSGVAEIDQHIRKPSKLLNVSGGLLIINRA